MPSHADHKAAVVTDGKQNLSRHNAAAEESLDLLDRRLGLLFLRHVTAILDQPEGRIWQCAPELKADAKRHDAVVVAPEDQGRELDRAVALGELRQAIGHDLSRAVDDGVFAGR